MSSTDLIVLGAGPAGLGAAFWGARAGRSVLVLERSDRVGGLAASFRVGGMRVDHGSHRLHPSVRPDILADLRRLLGAELQERRRKGRLRLGGRWIGFPLRPADVPRLPAALVVRLAWDVAAAPFRRPGDGSFAEAIRAGVGPTLGRQLYFPYARKIWGLEPEALSGEQARRRVSAPSPGALVRRVLRGGGGSFYYPAGGYGRIAECLAEAAAEAGAEVRLGWEVTGVELGDRAVRVEAGGRVLEGGSVLSTIPLTVLPRLVRPSAPPEVAEAALSLEFRAMVLAYAVLDLPRWTPFDAHYLPGPESPITRISEPRNYRSSPTDPSDRTVLCAEIPCRVGDGVWSAEPAELGELLVDTAERMGLPSIRAMQVEVRRLSRAYPVYRRGFEPHFRAIETWTGTLARLVTLGRQGLFAHDNTHHALAMAKEAVEALRPDGTVDRERWGRALAGFRRHVVED